MRSDFFNVHPGGRMARLTIKEVVQAFFVKSNVFFFRENKCNFFLVKTNVTFFREIKCNFFFREIKRLLKLKKQNGENRILVETNPSKMASSR